MAKSFKSAGNWLLDFVIEHLPAIVIGGVGLAMTWLASVAAFLRPYGAVAWGGVGILTVVLLALAYWVGTAGYRQWTAARLRTRLLGSASFNPLAGVFSKQRLRLADFFHPFFKPTSAAQFEDCELLGPASFYATGSHFINCTFFGCEVVIVKSGAAVVGVTAFENCTFSRTKFFLVTFFMLKPQYLSLKQQIGGLAPPVISDGAAGDL